MVCHIGATDVVCSGVVAIAMSGAQGLPHAVAEVCCSEARECRQQGMPSWRSHHICTRHAVLHVAAVCYQSEYRVNDLCTTLGIHVCTNTPDFDMTCDTAQECLPSAVGDAPADAAGHQNPVRCSGCARPVVLHGCIPDAGQRAGDRSLP